MAVNTALPKVSIVIPVYNGSNYLSEAIDSALAQTYQNCEILVVNDGSTDDGATEAVALSYGSKIRYFSKENGGTASALNTAIQNMEGEYFSWLSHDDLYYPEKVRLQVESLRQAQGKAICTCYTTTITADGRKWGEGRISERFCSSLNAFLALDKETGLNGCTLLIPKAAFDQYGLFDQTKMCTQDYDMWWRIARSYKVIVLKRRLVYYRHHENQTSILQQRNAFEEADVLRMRFIQDLSTEEVDRYLAGDDAHLAHSYTNYVKAGLPKTAAALIVCGYNLFCAQGKLKKAKKLLAKGILGSLSSDVTAATALERVLVGKKKRPRLMVYCEAWGKGSREQSILRWMAAFKDSYEFVMVFLQKEEDALPLPDEGMGFVISPSRIPVADLLLRLGMLLSADVLINHSNDSPQALSIYPAFANSGIATVCANHDRFLTPYTQAESPWRSQRDELLGYASVVVWDDHDSNLFYNALTSGPKSVWIEKSENASHSSENFEKWRILLNGVLCGEADEAVHKLTIPASREEVLSLEAAAFEEIIACRTGESQVPKAPMPLASRKVSFLLLIKTSTLMRPLRAAIHWLKKARARRNPVWR